MNRNKLALATAALSSCTLMSIFSLSSTPSSQMLGLKPMANFSIDYQSENQFSRFIVQQSSIKQLLSAYKPSWFYTSPLLGNAASIYLVPLKEVPTHETIKVKSKHSGQGGYVCYDVVRTTHQQTEKPKVLFIVPGVNCTLKDHHINATVKRALAQGYNCVVVNPVRPDPKKGIKDLEVIDYSKVEPIAESIETIKGLFGQDSEIFAIGFSLGSNHLMRHLGAHKNCKEVCGIKAAVSISGAYEVRASALVLKDRFFGVYDWYMRHELQETFSNCHFKVTGNSEDLKQRIKKARTLTEFDTLVRAPIFGYRGASRLFRDVSCDAYVPTIQTPLLALATKDDSITDFKFVPVGDLKRNPNVILAVLEKGGHCDLFFQNEETDGRAGEHQELAPLVALEFFDKAHEFFAITAE